MINWHRKIFKLDKAEFGGKLFETLMLQGVDNRFWFEPSITTSDPVVHFRLGFVPGEMRELWQHFLFVAKGSEPLELNAAGRPQPRLETERLEADVVIDDAAGRIAIYVDLEKPNKLLFKYTQLDGGGDDGWGSGHQVP